jgi:predicted glycosyltransferase
MSIDKKVKNENVVKNSNHSHDVKYITKKKFPVKVQYDCSVWDYKSESYKNDLENEFLQEGIVFIPKKLTKNSFELHNQKGKICKYFFEEGTLSDYCEVFVGDSISVQSEIIQPNI